MPANVCFCSYFEVADLFIDSVEHLLATYQC